MTHKGEIVHLSRVYDGNQSNKKPILWQYKKNAWSTQSLALANLLMGLWFHGIENNIFSMKKKYCFSNSKVHINEYIGTY